MTNPERVVPLPDPSLELLANPSDDATVDIVFVYLRDDSRVTGTGTKIDTFWPRDWLPKDLPNARIFSFGYPTSKLDGPRSSNSLITQLRRVWSGSYNRPTILLVDGFGLCDLIMTLMYPNGFLRYDPCLHISSIAFFGPLHEESEGLEHGHSRAQILESLQRMSPDDKQYIQLVFFEKIQAGKSIVPLRLETNLRVLEATAKDEYERRSDRSNTQFMQKYHLSACHFDDKEDGNYQNVIKFLKGRMERGEILRQGFQKSQLGTTDGGILHPENEIDSEFLDRQIRVYMFDIANNLYTRIYAEILCHTNQTMLNESLMGKVVQGLPTLLQDFALRLDMGDTDRDVMILVHNYQHAISQIFNEINSGSDPTFDSVRDNKMYNDDYLSELNQAMVSVRIKPFLIYATGAYRWLLHCLRLEFLVASTADNNMDEISRIIIGSLPEIRQVRRNSQSEKYTMTFQVNCNPRFFIAKQQLKGSADDYKILLKVLTLTGSADHVQALGLKHYMKQIWVDSHKLYLPLIWAIASQEGEEPTRESTDFLSTFLNPGPRDTQLLIWLKDTGLIVNVSGPRYFLVDIGQQLAWIGGVLQTPKHSDESHVTLYTPSITRGHDSLSTLSVVEDPGIIWNVQYKEDIEDIGPDIPNGRCWFNLLRNPVIVQGFPILRKPKPGLGLEVSLDVIAEATQATHITTFDGRTFIKGDRAMLVLAGQEPGLVVWHLLWNSGYNRSSYLDPRISYIPPNEADDLESVARGKLRHIVGWCENATIKAGDPNVEYSKIGRAGLQYLDRDCRHYHHHMSPGALIESSDCLSRNEKANNAQWKQSIKYSDRIDRLGNRFAVLYDVPDQRAWLVDATSALLHLVRMALENAKGHKNSGQDFNSELRIAEYQSMESKPNSITPAYSVLTNATNLTQKVYQGDTDRTFQSLVVSIERVLEMGFCGQYLINERNKCQKHLGGFEFLNMAQSTRDIRSGTIEMLLDGSWFSLAQKLEAIVLFGKEFGTLIEPGSPVCEHWDKVPTGQQYLTVRISDTKKRLADGTHWRIPEGIFKQGNCLEPSCDRSQPFRDDPETAKDEGTNFWEQVEDFPEGFAVIFRSGNISSSHPIDSKDSLGNGTCDLVSNEKSEIPPRVDSESPLDNHGVGQPNFEHKRTSVSTCGQADTKIPSVQKGDNGNDVTASTNENYDSTHIDRRTEYADIYIPALLLFLAVVIVPLGSDWVSFYWKIFTTSVSLTWLYYWVFIRKRHVQLEDNFQRNSLGTKVKSLLKWAVFIVMLLWLFVLSPAHIFVPTLLDLWTLYEDAPTHKPSEILYDRGDFSFGDISVDVFAIHGLGSNSSSAWTDRETNAQWLRDILPRHKQLNKIRVITLNHQTKWAFQVSAKTLRDHAIEMLREIDHLNQGRRPIIFIAHSFGGLLLKQALVLSLEESKRVSRMTRGIMFLGTPHRGSPTAFIGRLLACSAYWRGSSDVLLKYMSRNNDKLNDLDRDFRERYRPLRSTPEHGPIYIGNFLENRVERFQKVSLSATVDKEHGSLDYVEDVFLDTDHRGLNKFRSPDDPNFKIFLLHFMRAFDYCKDSS